MLNAARIVLEGSTSPMQVHTKKADGDTPVTQIDVLSGNFLVEAIRRMYPSDTINEEESGMSVGTSQRIWYVDPLDGTSSYARGLRYSTLGLALYEGGEPVLSVTCNPFDRTLLIAEREKGTFLADIDESWELQNQREVIVSEQELHKGTIYVDGLFNMKTTGPKLFLLQDIQEATGQINLRMTGSNIDQQMRVAMGQAEISITDAVGGFHDLAAGGFCIIEAGGRFTDIYGNAVTPQTQVAIGSNGFSHNHDLILELTQKHYEEYEGFR